MIRLVLLLAPLALSKCAALGRPWMDRGDDPAQRARKLLANMNITEKLWMLGGNGTMKPYVGAVTGNKRLGIPDLNLNDGPQGFRGHPQGSSTAWPSGLTIGASFDVAIAEAWGKGMGEEFAGKGANVQLGPGVCLARIPNDGRNFEYISGEDPFLGMTMVAPAVRGIQSQGVIANAKHYVNNNQETNRSSQTAYVDERTNFEIYYPPFEGAVSAGVGSVMCSYNLIDVSDQKGGKRWSCENSVTLGHLKNELGFKGWVMSDWGATHSASLVEGLDQEMPGGSKMKNVLGPLVIAGNISTKHVDDSVLRILTPMFQMGLFDRTNPTGHADANVTSEAHNKLARRLASASMVLLQNRNGALPIDSTTTQTIAVFGEQAQSPIVHGGGSGQVFPYYVSAPLDAIREAFGRGVPRPDVCGAPQNMTYNQADLNHTHAPSYQACCALCLALEGCAAYTWNKGRNGNCYLKSSPNQPRPNKGSFSAVMGPPKCLKGAKCVLFNDGSTLGTPYSTVATDAARADVAVVFVATTSGEGRDRNSLGLDNHRGNNDISQDALVREVAKHAKKTVVVMVHPGAVLTPWRKDVDSIIAAFMPGQEYGHAITDVLFGAVNPSAKLPLTFPDSESQYGWTQAQWPGAPAVSPRCLNWTTPGSDSHRCEDKDDPTRLRPNGSSTYSERLEVGYRFFDSHHLEPAFEFGAGLSYANWSYSDLAVTKSAVTFSLENTGSVAGAEVCQVYIKFPSGAGEPPSQLKGLQKVGPLKPGAKETVTIHLSQRSFSTWDVQSHAWTVEHGEFEVMVGRSSRDFRLRSKITI